jgi:hypothetical protein
METHRWWIPSHFSLEINMSDINGASAPDKPYNPVALANVPDFGRGPESDRRATRCRPEGSRQSRPAHRGLIATAIQIVAVSQSSITDNSARGSWLRVFSLSPIESDHDAARAISERTI